MIMDPSMFPGSKHVLEKYLECEFYNVGAPFDSSKLVNRTPISLLFVACKQLLRVPTCNWGPTVYVYDVYIYI